jgi:hypothetical protein
VALGKPNAIDCAAFVTGIGRRPCRCGDTVVSFARRGSRVASARVLAGVLILGALWITDGAAADRPAATLTEAAPLAWLEGHWTNDRETFGVPSWSWSEPHDRSLRKRHADGTETTLDLTIGAAAGKLVGALETVTSNGKRKSVVDFVITLTGDYPLVWHEAGLRYRFRLEGSGLSYALVPGDLARVDAQRSLRFVHMHGPTHRNPFPIIIELRFNAGRLSLRRVQGPQHGAAVDQIYLFDRAG